jgi:hypothetical protein
MPASQMTQHAGQPQQSRGARRRARRRTTTIVAAIVVALVCIVAIVAATRGGDDSPSAQTSAASPYATPASGAALVANDDLMRAGIRDLRGIIDRAAMKAWFLYPAAAAVRPGTDLGKGEWPKDPWTGKALTPGSGRGTYEYEPAADLRSYRLVGYLDSGQTYVVTGGMPKQMMVAYDHRGEEGIHLIRQYVEAYIREHGSCPPPSEVFHGGAVGRYGKLYWPSNPWDHYDMKQRDDRGSFAYSVSTDRRSYTLRLHRALKADYVLKGPVAN